MPSSGMWRRVGLLQAYVSEERVTNRLKSFLLRAISSTLKMEATHSSETSVYNKPSRRHIQGDVTLKN
jgi:hypothetical protein